MFVVCCHAILKNLKHNQRRREEKKVAAFGKIKTETFKISRYFVKLLHTKLTIIPLPKVVLT